jgi:hypothetical protein
MNDRKISVAFSCWYDKEEKILHCIQKPYFNETSYKCLKENPCYKDEQNKIELFSFKVNFFN